MSYHLLRVEPTSTADFLPARLSLASLKQAAANCKGCALYKRATQTVFGEGLATATMMLVGEQPGDLEDREGRPFVGPAGRLLKELLDEAGISRRDIYLTNAVKHFKWTPRGKRRLHSKPNSRELAACRPWLDAELKVIEPRLIVCLGATAAQQILGPTFRVTRQRGKVILESHALPVLATYHPSAVLRAPDDRRATMRAELLADLRVAVKYIKKYVKE
jgi:uracil-DNA glycosylase